MLVNVDPPRGRWSLRGGERRQRGARRLQAEAVAMKWRRVSMGAILSVPLRGKRTGERLIGSRYLESGY
jgi:hypothetical protein